MGYYKTDGFSAITPYNEDPTDYEADGYENRSARLGLGYRFDEGSIKASLHFIDADDEADLMTPDSKYDDTFLYRAYAIDANYQIDAHHITLHGDTTDTIRKFPDSAWGVKRFEGKTDMVELRDRFGYGVGSLQMGVGYQRYESDFERVDGVTGDVNYKDYYGYIVNKIRFGNLLLSQNIRYDDYDAFEDQWTGKIGMKYDFGPAALLANWGRAYNVPNQIEMLNPWGGVSNFDLDPEKTTGWDVGFKAGGWKVVYFKEKVKDLIVWENNQFVNKSGTSIFEGIEMSFKHAFTDNLYAQVGFTWLDPRDSEGKRLLRRAKTKYTYSFDWYPTERHTINLSGYFVGKRLDRDYQRGEIVETGSYNVTNLTASHRFAKNFTGYLQVRNLFDRRYQEAYNYGSAPRGFYAGIRASF
jgi:vitamin B12 transporter